MASVRPDWATNEMRCTRYYKPGTAYQSVEKAPHRKNPGYFKGQTVMKSNFQKKYGLPSSKRLFAACLKDFCFIRRRRPSVFLYADERRRLVCGPFSTSVSLSKNMSLVCFLTG